MAVCDWSQWLKYLCGTEWNRLRCLCKASGEESLTGSVFYDCINLLCCCSFMLTALKVHYVTFFNKAHKQKELLIKGIAAAGANMSFR